MEKTAGCTWRDSICISVDADDDGNPPTSNIEDEMFDKFQDKVEEKVHMGRFIAALTETGLRRTDPRLKEMMKNLQEMHALLDYPQASSVTALHLDRETFKNDRLASPIDTPLRKSPLGSPRKGVSPIGSPVRKMSPIPRFQRSRSQSPAFEGRTPITSPTSLFLDRDQFKAVINDNVTLISRALRHQFVIPDWGEFCNYIEDFFYLAKPLQGGHVASYIPQLARFSPEYWGVSVCTTDGQRFSIGDTNINFTMQSCSKPITYGIALNELGADTVHRYVGQEPSGRMFNALVLDYNNKPHNPLVNAGSIITNSLLYSLVEPKMSSSEKFDYLQQYFRRMAGNENVGFSNGTFLSERDNADRNYALAYYMRENNCYPEKCDLMASLDLYFQCCSMEVNCESVSVMAATLANGGICPITGDQVLNPSAVRDVLSLMHSCGMYDYSGQFAFKVGLPAKSGVCGAIMLVIPNVMGVCAWSPPLDATGNSVRGIRFCEEMVRVFNFHRYDNLRHAANKKDPRKKKFETQGQKVMSLLFSACSGDVTALRRYALSNIDMGQSDYDGRTALHLGAVEGHLDVVEFLLEKCNVNPNPVDRWGRTPSGDAREFGHEVVADYIDKCIKEAKEKEKEKENSVKLDPPVIPEEDEKSSKEE